VRLAYTPGPQWESHLMNHLTTSRRRFLKGTAGGILAAGSGAKKTNPNATVQVIFTGDWSLPVREAEAVQKILSLTGSVNLTVNDNPTAQAYRGNYAEAAAKGPPRVIQCDTTAGDTWYHGKYLGERAEAQACLRAQYLPVRHGRTMMVDP
jgi:hypothetical protein